METFTVIASINCVVEKDVKAESWEEAVAEAKKLKTPDFIQPVQGRSFMDFEEPVIDNIGKS